MDSTKIGKIKLQCWVMINAHALIMAMAADCRLRASIAR
jgi:hypothetical protein